MSGYETIMVDVLARMKASPPVVPLANIRRAHLTAVPRSGAPAIHVIDGEDKPAARNKCGGREGKLTVAIFGRSDAGPSATDPYKIAVMARMAAAWPVGILCVPGAIVPNVEVADTDVIRVDMEFSVSYPTADEWAL